MHIYIAVLFVTNKRRTGFMEEHGRRIRNTPASYSGSLL